MTGTDDAARAVERELAPRQPRTIRQLERTTGISSWQLRVVLTEMRRQGKVRVRQGLAGPEVVPIGNN